MQTHEYKVVPAPRKGDKARGLKAVEDRFAYALTRLMNEMALDGWEYLRTDTLPVEERTGLTGRVSTSFQSLLVFRRALRAANPAGPEAFRAPEAVRPAEPVPPRLSAHSENGAAPALGGATD